MNPCGVPPPPPSDLVVLTLLGASSEPVSRLAFAQVSPFLRALLTGEFAEAKGHTVALPFDPPEDYEGTDAEWQAAAPMFLRLLSEGAQPLRLPLRLWPLEAPWPAEDIAGCLTHLALLFDAGPIQAALREVLTSNAHGPPTRGWLYAACALDLVGAVITDGHPAWPGLLAATMQPKDALALLRVWNGEATPAEAEAGTYAVCTLEEGGERRPVRPLVDVTPALAAALEAPLVDGDTAVACVGEELLQGAFDVRAFLLAHPGVSLAGGAVVHAATSTELGRGAGDVDLWVHRHEAGTAAQPIVAVVADLLRALGSVAVIVGGCGPVLTLAIAGVRRNLQLVHTGGATLGEVLYGFDAPVVQVGLQAQQGQIALRASPAFLQTHASGVIPWWVRSKNRDVRATKYARRGYTPPQNVEVLPEEHPALVASDLKEFVFEASASATYSPRLIAELLHKFKQALPMPDAVFLPSAAAADTAEGPLAPLLREWAATSLQASNAWEVYHGSAAGAMAALDTGTVSGWFAQEAAPDGSNVIVSPPEPPADGSDTLITKLKVLLTRDAPGYERLVAADAALSVAIEGPTGIRARQMAGERRPGQPPQDYYPLLRPRSRPYMDREEVAVAVQVPTNVRVVEMLSGTVMRGLRLTADEVRHHHATGTLVRVVGCARVKWNGTSTSAWIVASTIYLLRRGEQ